MDRRTSLTWPTVLLALGLALLGFYALARRYGIAEIGSEGDIGGGLIPLLGLVLVGVGGGKLVRRLVRRRGSSGTH